MEQREAELLPVPYFHVVFTLPQIIAKLALQNKKVVYDILFQATSSTLQEVAANPKHLGARIGFFAVLHTWGQRMELHPHLHCVIPAGGLSLDRQRWVYCKHHKKRKLFFLPVAVLSQVFAGKFISYLRRAYQRNELAFFGDLKLLEQRGEFERFLDTAVTHRWVVYAKRPFADTTCVLKYLSRYTHRVAIANSRLQSMSKDGVVFQFKDYRNNSAIKEASFKPIEFIRRFLQHVLPKSFVRIRHFGFVANRVRKDALALCRDLLGVVEPVDEDEQPLPQDLRKDDEAQSEPCPNCKSGRIHVIQSWEPGERVGPRTSLERALFAAFDTS